MAEPTTTPGVVPERDDLSFLTDGRHTDVEFLVEDGSDSPKSFRAHKAVLAMRNEVFEAMFYGNLAEGDQVRITDLHPDGFSTFLKYLYRQTAIFVDIQQALRARTAAQKYMDSKLVNSCDMFIQKSMQPADVCDVMEYAMKHGNITNFDTVVDRHLQENAGQVLGSKSFMAASKETVLKILKNPRLRLKEYDVIKSVYGWVSANCESKIGKPSTTVLQWSMRPFLPELRFLTLTSLEFVEGPSSWDILTESETLAVLSNIIKRGSIKLPLGICASTEHRTNLPSKQM
ncbi:unnamed protein product, partial [Ixodes hexagonus]